MLPKLPGDPGPASRPESGKGRLACKERPKRLTQNNAAADAVQFLCCGKTRSGSRGCALFQGLQGDKAWAEWLTNNGCGKPVETLNLLSSPRDVP